MTYQPFINPSLKLIFHLRKIRCDPKHSYEWGYNEILPVLHKGLVGDRVNSFVLQGSRSPSNTILLILKYYFCTSRLPSLPLHDLSAYCSRAGCPGPSVATVTPPQTGPPGRPVLGDTNQRHKLYSSMKTRYL
jgi:hypothetical protein